VTVAEIVTAITPGVRPDGRVPSPMMPWASFHNRKRPARVAAVLGSCEANPRHGILPLRGILRSLYRSGVPSSPVTRAVPVAPLSRRLWHVRQLRAFPRDRRGSENRCSLSVAFLADLSAPPPE
jgi:hypothetical protein